MILTRGPSDLGLGYWFLLCEDTIFRFNDIVRASAHARMSEEDPIAKFYVHWSMLDDAERDRCFTEVHGQ